MSHSCNYQHIVFHTAHSQATIPEGSKRILFAYIFAMCRSHNVALIRINSYLNHVHMLVKLPPTTAVADFVKMVKQNTSVAFKGHAEFPNFCGWNEGYGAFSVSMQNVDMVVNYIKRQEQHHGNVSYKDEYIALLHENHIAVDEYTLKKL